MITKNELYFYSLFFVIIAIRETIYKKKINLATKIVSAKYLLKLARNVN